MQPAKSYLGERCLPAGARREWKPRKAGTGTLLGVQYQETSTYESELRPDGTLFGTGQGVYMGAGGEMATWTARASAP